MTTSAIERTAAPAQLTRAVDRLTAPDVTLLDVKNVIYLLATADDLDLLRAQAVLALVNKALNEFSTHVVCAPPAALNDLVADVVTPCVGADFGCTVRVAPWDDVACSEECRGLHLHAVGSS